ncbi:MAG: zinc ribbon domain-containing protein [Candidatus Heimdallarchaeota archaeon]|nr:MAG: zinc ribbon domain-containing protein [Candidatus Heimdallarchaeota archaeon]
MNNPLAQISGQIVIKGRVYSAKDIIRGLLEQGIAITESPDGLKIGFKVFSPQTTSPQFSTEGNNNPGCPFIPFMSQITDRLEDLTSRLNSQNDVDVSPSKQTFSSSFAEDPSTLPFSPFNSPSSFSKTDEEREKFFNSTTNFFDDRQKCPSCGAVLPTNAFFCNKCGNHVRSG